MDRHLILFMIIIILSQVVTCWPVHDDIDGEKLRKVIFSLSPEKSLGLVLVLRLMKLWNSKLSSNPAYRAKLNLSEDANVKSLLTNLAEVIEPHLDQCTSYDVLRETRRLERAFENDYVNLSPLLQRLNLIRFNICLSQLDMKVEAELSEMSDIGTVFRRIWIGAKTGMANQRSTDLLVFETNMDLEDPNYMCRSRAFIMSTAFILKSIISDDSGQTSEENNEQNDVRNLYQTLISDSCNRILNTIEVPLEELVFLEELRSDYKLGGSANWQYIGPVCLHLMSDSSNIDKVELFYNKYLRNRLYWYENLHDFESIAKLLTMKKQSATSWSDFDIILSHEQRIEIPEFQTKILLNRLVRLAYDEVQIPETLSLNLIRNLFKLSIITPQKCNKRDLKSRMKLAHQQRESQNLLIYISSMNEQQVQLCQQLINNRIHEALISMDIEDLLQLNQFSVSIVTSNQIKSNSPVNYGPLAYWFKYTRVSYAQALADMLYLNEDPTPNDPVEVESKLDGILTRVCSPLYKPAGDNEIKSLFLDLIGAKYRMFHSNAQFGTLFLDMITYVQICSRYFEEPAYFNNVVVESIKHSKEYFTHSYPGFLELLLEANDSNSD